ncbi:hypothetical protein CkaCkLH20_12929 [Colletotrichum karsti]|uniref:Uncharacterized protein n=1 Tax=Colletotrichum karsti TaxID=1095194 RepID=A0A9P6HTV6_9PEZI|nr:uncharacterized protein CkaCkLH20_12929 [Colletotrichum karsti]KAF9869632.1 hypothetical protein CkaCkLH20_12929 [Colletotrichum karsti]
MATPIDSPHRPSLHPLWTSQYNLGGFPRSSGRPANASYFSQSDRSPKSLPTPVFPSNDGSMRQHERAMVDRLGQRLRQQQRPDLSPRKSASRPSPLSPLAELSISVPDGRRYSAAQISPGLPPPPVTPVSPSMPMPMPRSGGNRRQTLAAENRSMLLAGLGEEAKRRQSVPNANFIARSKDAEKRHHQEQLRAWGHVYLGDAKTSDVFVQAVSLRRDSNASTNSDNSAGDSSPTRMPTTPTIPSHQTAIRARVRPRALERKPFLIQRTFDIEQLRSTVPDPLPSSPGADQRRRPSLAGSPLPKVASPRPSMARRRSSSAAHSAHSPLPYSRGIKSESSRAPSRGASTMPIHLQYARSSLPVLAALIVSGHITAGDVIDLPLPHPEVWPSTVAYVYTGQGDLTDAVRENILYLAGKV